MIIRELTADTRPAWDEFVRSRPSGLPQHLSGWQDVLRRTYGHEPHYLAAWENDQIVGVLPLFLISSLLLGDTARTMPGGLCADNDEAATTLLAAGRAWAEQANVRRFLVADTRQRWPVDLPTTTNHVYWVVDTETDPAALWKRLDGNIRRQVRIARRNKLRVEIDRCGELLDTFYELFSTFAHQSGTPLYSRQFLDNVISTFPEGYSIAIVYQEEKPLGAYFQLELDRIAYGMWGGTPRQYLDLRPVYLTLWEILSDAADRGYQAVDMGRSPTGSNASHFKKQWGGTSYPIYQQGVVLGGSRHDKAPGRGRSFQLVASLWPKLPLPVARYLGPKLRRHVPFA